MLVQAFIAQTAVELLDERILHRLAGAMSCHSTPVSSTQLSTRDLTLDSHTMNPMWRSTRPGSSHVFLAVLPHLLTALDVIASSWFAS